jgi:hypothetical protein
LIHGHFFQGGMSAALPLSHQVRRSLTVDGRIARKT